MKLSNVEKETIILFNEGEREAEVYTHNKKLVGKLKKANEMYPEIFVIKRATEEGSVTCTMDKSRLSIRLNLPISEGRSQQIAKQLKDGREQALNHPVETGDLRTGNPPERDYPTAPSIATQKPV